MSTWLLYAAIAALMGALIVVWARAKYLRYLTTLALEYAGASFGSGVVPPPRDMLRGIVNRAERLEHRARFIAEQIREECGVETTPLGGVHEAFVGFVKDARALRGFGDCALRFEIIINYALALAKADNTSGRLAADLYKWVTDVERWMRVTHHIYKRVIRHHD